MFEDDRLFHLKIAKYCRPPYNPQDYLDESKDWFREGYADRPWIKQLWNMYRPLCPAPIDGRKPRQVAHTAISSAENFSSGTAKPSSRSTWT